MSFEGVSWSTASSTKRARWRRGGRGGRGGRGQGNPNSPPAPRLYGHGNITNIKCAYQPCGKPGHTEAQCWMKYPHLRPQPFVPRGNQGGVSPSGSNNVEARLAELQDTLARLVAASAQPTPGATGLGASTSTLHLGYLIIHLSMEQLIR